MDGGKRFLPASGAQDKTIINQIMLKFRPIAPKPTTDDFIAGISNNASKKELVARKRAKRKYVRVNKNAVCVKNKAEEPTVKMLQLLPKESPARGLSTDSVICLKQLGDSDRTAVGKGAVESWVTMECVTDTCEEERGRLGCTDNDKMKSLEMDTCPGFISNGVDAVEWVNMAYKRMVDPRDGGGAPPREMVVWLVVKEKFPVMCGAFSCRVRVVYKRGIEKHYTQTMPCDVWRMEFGGFAWRLDVEAALSLGR